MKGNHFFGKHHAEESIKKLRKSKIQNYIDDPKLRDLISQKTKEAMTRPEIKEKFENAMQNRAVPYKIIKPNGEEEVVNNLNKYCKQNKLTFSHMYEIVKTGKHHKG